MKQPPLSPRQIKRALKPRPASQQTKIRVVFEPPIQPSKVGARVFPKPIKGSLLKRLTRSASPSASAEMDDSKLNGFLPDHLAFNPYAPTMDKKLVRPKFFDPTRKLKKGEYRVTTIFPPDQRRVFSDTSFPWCTVGRVDLGGGFGSGTLVGPRHLLCASHMMTWNPDNTVNQVTFTPSYFDGNGPFGNSGIIHWYAYQKVVGPNISGSQIAQDYVLLVLSNRLGDICGWMGTRGYSDSWNGLAVWSHIGYPGDLHGGTDRRFKTVSRLLEPRAVATRLTKTLSIRPMCGRGNLAGRFSDGGAANLGRASHRCRAPRTHRRIWLAPAMTFHTW
jgi:V8-like Glu-specific endopeptidase